MADTTTEFTEFRRQPGMPYGNRSMIEAEIEAGIITWHAHKFLVAHHVTDPRQDEHKVGVEVFRNGAKVGAFVLIGPVMIEDRIREVICTRRLDW